MKRVTVVSVYYNRGHCVDETIESLLSQDEKDMDFIIVDDGSTDDTLAKLTAHKDPRLKIIHQENQGFVRGVIRAVSESTTPYVAILGSGDVALPGRFRKQADYLDAHPECGAVGCSYEVVRERTGTTEVSIANRDMNYKESLLFRNYFDHSEMMFRRSVYDAVGGYRTFFVYGQDYDLWLRINERSDMYALPEILNRSFRRLESVSGNPVKYGLQQRLGQMANYCARERRAGRPDPIDKYGHLAAFIRPKMSRFASNIAKQALKCTYRGQIDQARELQKMLRGDAYPLNRFLLDAVLALPASIRDGLIRSVKFVKARL